MHTVDRSIKWLLGVIAILLAFIAFRPYVSVIRNAGAQDASAITESDATDDRVVLGYRTSLVSQIPIEKNNAIRDVYVLDKAQSFVVRYDNKFVVYRTGAVTAPDKVASKSND